MSVLSLSYTQAYQLHAERRLARPDAPGIWHFTGTVYVPRRTAIGAHELVFYDWPFRIVRHGEQFAITDVDSGERFRGEWIGQWEAKEFA